ncbi:hypothetical protein [Amycolatopsis palatopharyngis]|uniref:hypothetical protein n=1 Tax=Amycolatopsis palatopharyngis TaxID=187982 RepID=UPI000E25C5D4|nr:hypothetical protein [Amycolatopsis palatopharyngis]
MAEAISDAQVVGVLRPFVRATGSLLDALRESDPLGLRARAAHQADGNEDLDKVDPGTREKLLNALTSVKVPGTSAWADMGPDQRTNWWINRVGRFTSLLTAIPGLGGALADRLPVQDALGAAAQGLLLCAIAGEHGVTEVGDRVRLLAWVLFERDVDPELAAGRTGEHDAAAEDAKADELTEELSESSRKHGKVTIRACGRTLWRLGRSLLAFPGELEKRPRGRLYHRFFGMLPVVGMVADYFGERSGLKRVARRARRWLEQQQPGRPAPR